jgi:sulfur transfer complex TusBCD TusB component (DsrH family)
MSLYLVDRRYGDLALDMIAQDETAKVVFIQDGVYLKYSGENRETYYISNDVESRGIKDLPENTRLVSYDDLMKMMTSEDVYNFI